MYKALHTGTGKTYAIKQVHTHSLSDDQLSAIHMEIQLLRRLQHPHIVEYIGKP